MADIRPANQSRNPGSYERERQSNEELVGLYPDASKGEYQGKGQPGEGGKEQYRNDQSQDLSLF